MKLSLVILIYNEDKSLLDILKKVESVTLSKIDDSKIEKEIIIVDDLSSNKSKEILKELEKKNKYKMSVFYSLNNESKIKNLSNEDDKNSIYITSKFVGT